MRILLRRIGALGDVIQITPVLRRLRRAYPHAEIGVQTAYPDVFRDSPHALAGILPPSNPPYVWTTPGGLDRLIDLDNVYENSPRQHVVDAYMQAAFGDPGEPADKQPELAYRPVTPWPAGRQVVAIHAAKAGWRNRTLPEATWLRVIEMLRAEGIFPLLVGSGRDALEKARCASFLSTDILGQAAMIARCACFIGSDSALLHVAGATAVPIVGVFTCVRPEYRLPWRGGALGGGCEAVVPDLWCVGCQERRTPPVTNEACELVPPFDGPPCVDAVLAEQIVAAALRLIAVLCSSRHHPEFAIRSAGPHLSDEGVPCLTSGARSRTKEGGVM